MAVSEFGYRKALVSRFCPLWQGVSPCMVPFLVSKAYFSGSHYLRDLIDSSLISGCR